MYSLIIQINELISGDLAGVILHILFQDYFLKK